MLIALFLCLPFTDEIAIADNGVSDLLVCDARRGVNQGMIYELGTFTPEQQLAMLDAVAAAGYKVLYDLMSPLCALRPEDTACMNGVRYNGLNGTGQNCIGDNPVRRDRWLTTTPAPSCVKTRAARKLTAAAVVCRTCAA